MNKTAPPDIWKKLMILGKKEGEIKLKDLALEMGLGAEETLLFLKQIFPVGICIDTYHKDNECWVSVKADAIQYMLPLSPSEWIQLHQVLTEKKNKDDSVFNSLKKKVTENGPIKVVMDLFNQLELWDHELSDFEPSLVKQIDAAIKEKATIDLTITDGNGYVVYPCKILHLEGKLSLIAEDSQDHCLLVVPLQRVSGCETVSINYQPRASSFEVDEFITAIRAMNEKETRLILKIHDPQTTNLFPDHHFLGKPCMITNPNGDLIWAAYVEPCEALYEWLMGMGEKTEILDPIKFKDEYLTYCEGKLKKVA